MFRRLRPPFATSASLLLAAVALAGAGCRGGGDRSEQTVVHRPDPVAVGAGPAIVYTLRFTGAAQHALDVEAVYPAEGRDVLELMMAVWTPGSYLIREYSRHLEGLSATTAAGEPLALVKTAKNRWQITTGGAERVVLRYRLYARDLTVRTNFVDADRAVINGAPTFVTVADAGPRPHEVVLELPEAWTAATALPVQPEGGPHRYLAPDFDTLVDSPIIAGELTAHELSVEGVPHLLVELGGAGIFDGARAARDLEALVAEQLRFWRLVPYERYWFLSVLADGASGGLEHKTSTLMLGSRWVTRNRSDYLGWLGLASHELFHTWNGKRLRPRELGPFDYEQEAYTHSLWVVEGFTSYYDDLLVRRAGLMTEAEYLDRLSKQIESLQKTPGRAVQALAQSSFDAWIKYYRPDESSINTSISYYTKGAVVAFLLDAEIRRVTHGRRSLDDVLRTAYQRYAGERGYTPEELRAVVAEVAGAPLDGFFAAYVDGTEELDFGPALETFGLRFAEAKKGRGAAAGEAEEKEEAGWLGADLNDALVRRVPRGTPAFDAGLNVADEILAIDGHRVAPGKLDELLGRYRPGDAVTLLIARDGRVRPLPAVLGRSPDRSWKLEPLPRASSAALAHRRAWLSPTARK